MSEVMNVGVMNVGQSTSPTTLTAQTIPNNPTTPYTQTTLTTWPLTEWNDQFVQSIWNKAHRAEKMYT